MPTSEPNPAAFFRVEGTLLEPGVLRAAAYFAANAQGFKERAFRLGQVFAAAPFALALGQNDRGTANRALYLPCRGMGEDRIEVLSEEYFEEVLAGALLPRGVELIGDARAQGLEIFLLSESIEQIANRIAERVGPVDHVLANRLEMRAGFATGRLLDPVVGGYEAGRWVRALADDGAVDLARSRAYAAHGPDLMLLDAVGKPCAVNPDYTLRRAAREADWPVVYYDA